MAFGMTKWDDRLYDLNLSAKEKALTEGMPAPVAVGYVLARRKSEKPKGFGDILGEMFQ